jgi:hypothetical protein
MDDIRVVTEQDKEHVAYGLCVLGLAGVGATWGAAAGGQILLGAAGGTVVGLFSCRHLHEPIKRKLFSRNGRLSEEEFRLTLIAAQREFPFASKTRLLDLIAEARIEAAREPSRYRC